MSVDKITSPISPRELIEKTNEIIDDKLSKSTSNSIIYGTDSTGAQQNYTAGANVSLDNGQISVTGVQQQIFIMPTPTASLVGNIVQYMGEDNEDYTHGVLYQCVAVYSDFTLTKSEGCALTGLSLDASIFKSSPVYEDNIMTYEFTCTKGGLSQRWRLPNGGSTIGGLSRVYGISYVGRPAVDDVLTVSKVFNRLHLGSLCRGISRE